MRVCVRVRARVSSFASVLWSSKSLLGTQTIWLSLHKCHTFVVPATLAVGDSLFSVCSSLTASNMSPLSLALVSLLFVSSGFDGDMQFYFGG